MSLAAVVQAGGRSPASLRPLSEMKGHLPLAGKALQDYVLRAVAEAKVFDEHLIIGRRASFDDDRFRWLEPSDSWIENVVNAAKAASSDELLFVTADAPFLRADVLEAFVRGCEDYPGDIHYPLGAEALLERAYPGTKRTYGTLREGRFTGGNCLKTKRAVVFENEPLYQRVFEGRKSVVTLASILGIRFILMLLLGRLTAAKVEARLSQILNGRRLRAVFFDRPELFFDVDKEEDLRFAQERLSGRNPADS